jgi:hypothetical protein
VREREILDDVGHGKRTYMLLSVWIHGNMCIACALGCACVQCNNISVILC